MGGWIRAFLPVILRAGCRSREENMAGKVAAALRLLIFDSMMLYSISTQRPPDTTVYDALDPSEARCQLFLRAARAAHQRRPRSRTLLRAQGARSDRAADAPRLSPGAAPGACEEVPPAPAAPAASAGIAPLLGSSDRARAPEILPLQGSSDCAGLLRFVILLKRARVARRAHGAGG